MSADAALRRRTTVGFAAAAMLVSYLPFSAVNGALGAIGRTADAGTSSLQWVTDAFTVALTGAVLSGGFDGVQLLRVGQAVAGVGAGLVMAASLSLIAATAPDPAARTQAIALWAAANVAGLGSGPFLAAAVPSWRWLFVPTALLAVGAAAYGPLRSREIVDDEPGRPDHLGQVTGTIGIVVLAAVFVVERRVVNPVLPPALFSSPGFTAAGAAAAAALFAIPRTTIH
ncbi:hypothetical protein [Cryptosporangium arvum]|uniref:Arabinose efflux permease family protein n=1 Tax=Cryptosporangium arvum DSM 44712 TaxID=927661 RepID=A0A011AGL6_9ACTN|nr:hypothetical protein [Cryptosporangium arvum]EXG81151.1 hypothetical protein CryarDRAFT_2257 [Cryptosporangium arvum DSM 44712]